MTENNNATASGEDGQKLGNELWRYRIGVVDVILFEHAAGSHLYKTAGFADTPSEAAEHDGPAIKDGDYRNFVVEDGGFIRAYHPHAGRRGNYAMSDEFDEPVELLTELNHVE